MQQQQQQQQQQQPMQQQQQQQSMQQQQQQSVQPSDAASVGDGSQVTFGTAERLQSESQDIVPALPNDWQRFYDESTQSTYYFNESTGETSWTAPNRSYESDGYDTTASRDTAIDYDTDNAGWGGYDTDPGYGAAPGSGGGGSDWVEHWDDQAQAKYWFNTVTHEASWTQPEEMGGGAAADEWMSYIDADTGKEYWINQLTNETSWTPPH